MIIPSNHKISNKHIINNISKYTLLDSIDKIAKNNRTIIIVPNLCNLEYKYGGVFSDKLANLYPIVKESYNILGKNFIQQNPGYVQYNTVANYHNSSKIIVANMLCQQGLTNKFKKRTINYSYLVDSMNKIKTFIYKLNQKYQDEHYDIEIHTYKFGTNRSCNANWSFIVNLIEDIWSSNKIFIYNE